MDSQKKHTNLFSIRWAEKLRPKDGWHFLLLWEEVQLQNWQTFLPRFKEKLRKWKTFPLFHTRVNGHDYLLLLRSSARKVDSVSSIRKKNLSKSGQHSSRSHEKVPERLLLHVKKFSQKRTAFPNTLEKKFSPKKGQHFLPLLRGSPDARMDSISSFSNKFAKKGHPFSKEESIQKIDSIWSWSNWKIWPPKQTAFPPHLK